MSGDSAYRGLGSVLASVAVGWVATRAGMSNWESFAAFAIALVGLQMVAGNKFWG